MKSLEKMIFILPFLAVFPAGAAQITSNSLESKIALENSLEKKLHMVLSEALGTDDIIVMISAQLQEQEKKQGFAEILPGIPREEKLGEKTLSESLSMVKKISATVILDKSVPKEDEKVVRDLTAGLLGLPKDREDLISVERMTFRKQNAFTLRSLFYPPNLWFSVFSALLALFIFFVVRSFFVPLASSLRNMASAMTASSSANDRAAGDMGGPALEKPAEKAEAEKAVSGDREPLFGFLKNANVSNLIFVMQNKSVEELTIVLNYAPEDMAAQLIESLYPQSLQAVKLLPKVVLMPEARIKSLESELRSSLDFVVGGEQKAKDILQSLDDSVQDRILADVAESSPETFDRLSSQIVKFSSIGRLEPAHAQLLSRRTGMKTLAAALKNSPLKDEFTLKLSEGMRERFKEELDLIRVVPAGVEKAERRKVVLVVKQLIADGHISLNGKTPAPSPSSSWSGPAPLPESRTAAPEAAQSKPQEIPASSSSAGSPVPQRGETADKKPQDAPVYPVGTRNAARPDEGKAGSTPNLVDKAQGEGSNGVYMSFDSELKKEAAAESAKAQSGQTGKKTEEPKPGASAPSAAPAQAPGVQAKTPDASPVFGKVAPVRPGSQPAPGKAPPSARPAGAPAKTPGASPVFGKFAPLRPGLGGLSKSSPPSGIPGKASQDGVDKKPPSSKPSQEAK